MKHVQSVFLLLAVLAPALHAAEPLGRLFFTPAQRNTLDAGKQLDIPRKTGPTVRGPRSLTVNGIVTRSDGESTVWVNGSTAGVKRQGAAPISAKPSDSTTARVQTSGTSARLRVGQTLNRSTGRIQEAYEAKPPAAEPAVSAPAPAVPGGDSGNPDNTPGQDGKPEAH